MNWNLIDNCDGYFYLDNIQDDTKDLTLILSHVDTKKRLKIIFSNPLSYQKTNSGDFIKSSGLGSFKGVFLQIENSSYLKWFLDESCDNWIDENVIHYSIRSRNDVIDILSPFSVSVEWVDN